MIFFIHYFLFYINYISYFKIVLDILTPYTVKYNYLILK